MPEAFLKSGLLLGQVPREQINQCPSLSQLLTSPASQDLFPSFPLPSPSPHLSLPSSRIVYLSPSESLCAFFRCASLYGSMCVSTCVTFCLSLFLSFSDLSWSVTMGVSLSVFLFLLPCLFPKLFLIK